MGIMKNNIMKYFESTLLCCALGLVLAFSSCKTNAQITAPVEIIEGKSYYMHTVEKGQTLYSLGKLYKCDINEILSANPGAETSIQEGATIKIPKDKSGVKGPSQVTVSGKNYITHEVQKRETLFSIARDYKVDVNDIIAANPGVENGLKKGQVINIPSSTPAAPATKPEKIDQFVKHKVLPGETLFAISRQYKVPVDAIMNANPGMSEALKEGQIVNVPTRALPNDHSVDSPPTEDKPKNIDKPIAIIGGGKKDKYTISLMLPFYADQADSLLTEKDRLYRDAALQIYRGIQLAADSLKKIGFNADIIVNDVIDNKTSAKEAVEVKANIKADLIIGPAFKDAVVEVCNLSNQTGAHVVLPFPLSNKSLLNTQNISKAVPSDATVWESMGRWVVQNHGADQVILVNSKELDDARQVQLFQASYKATKGDTVLMVTDNGSLNKALLELLSKSKRNVLVVPTMDKKVIAAVFEAIKNTNSIVYGLDKWETYEAISADNRNKYNVAFPKSLYLDYNEEFDQNWIETFRKKFKTEPSNFAVLGYDMMLYYGTGLVNYGRDFPNNFSNIKVNGLVGTGFDYFKTGSESGFENRFCKIYRTEEFELKPVN
jgi:LysM repeat protein/ABC-type branched-subunit amino acid transport system substrate-binding protein